MSVIFEVVVAVVLAAAVVMLVLILKEIDECRVALDAFIVEFRLHFDDAYMRKLLKKIGVKQGRVL